MKIGVKFDEKKKMNYLILGKPPVDISSEYY